MLLVGNLNGRTGTLNDVYDNPDAVSCTPIPNAKPSTTLTNRENRGRVVNSNGERIIKFCHPFDFKILNGRFSGDAIGNFTHLNNKNGPSAN